MSDTTIAPSGGGSADHGPVRVAAGTSRERDLILGAIDRASPRGGSGSRSRVGIAPELPPDVFPGYEIVREVHRGGQGAVFQALQKATQRKVAIKVIHGGPFAGPAEQARFEREVRFLGQLRHPNIVSIHDSGRVAGNFFLVMDYVSGRSLDELVREGQLPVDKAIKLFLKVCEGMGAAHLRGIIHRDLKPANIRLDSGGEPRVLDFGLARMALAESTDADSARLMTITGQFVGSLPWASPEQASGAHDRVDVRTDVYSLGVILYQMLTGRFPYAVTGHNQDVLNNILNTEPTRPSTVSQPGRRINDEVETIVLKCLSKAPDRRYQSAGELARDLQRYLNGEPIEAKRDSGWYMLTKTLRRYRTPVIAGGVLGATLVAFSIAMTVLYGQKAAAQKRETIAHAATSAALADTDAARQLAEAQRAAAQDNFEAARALARTLLYDFSDKIENLRGGTQARALLRTTALDALKTLSEGPSAEKSRDAGFQRELADAYDRVGDIESGLVASALGKSADAAAHYANARTIREQLLRENPEAPWAHAGIGQSLVRAGAIALAERRYDDARQAFTQAIDRFDAASSRFAPASPDAITAQDGRRRATTGVGDALVALAEVAFDGGKEADAEQLLAEATDLYVRVREGWKQRVQSAPNDTKAARALGVIEDKRALARSRLGRAAVRAAERAHGAGDAATAQRQLDTGLTRLSEAAGIASAAAPSFEALAAAQPQNLVFLADIGMAYHNAGTALMESAQALEGLGVTLGVPDAAGRAAGLHTQALVLFEKALSAGTRLFSSDESDLLSQRELAVYQNKVGNQHASLGRLAEAARAYEESLRLRREYFTTDATPRHRRDVAQACFKAGRMAQQLAITQPEGAARTGGLRQGLALLEESYRMFEAGIPEAQRAESRDLKQVQAAIDECRAALGEQPGEQP